MKPQGASNKRGLYKAPRGFMTLKHRGVGHAWIMWLILHLWHRRFDTRISTSQKVEERGLSVYVYEPMHRAPKKEASNKRGLCKASRGFIKVWSRGWVIPGSCDQFQIYDTRILIQGTSQSSYTGDFAKLWEFHEACIQRGFCKAPRDFTPTYSYTYISVFFPQIWGLLGKTPVQRGPCKALIQRRPCQASWGFIKPPYWGDYAESWEAFQSSYMKETSQMPCGGFKRHLGALLPLSSTL